MKQKTYLRRLLADIAKQLFRLILASPGNHLASLVNRLYPYPIKRAVDLVVLPDAAHLAPTYPANGLVILFATLIQWLNPLIYNQMIYRYSKDLRRGHPESACPTFYLTWIVKVLGFGQSLDH